MRNAIDYRKRGRLGRVVMIILGVCVAFMLIGDVSGWKLFNADRYASLLPVEEGDFAEDVEALTYKNIPTLDDVSAAKLANRKLGDLADIVSQYVIRDSYTQINYRGRPVRVTTLVYGDLIKWINNTSTGLPAYLYIDMVTQEVTLVRLTEGIHYTPDEHFNLRLDRHLRFLYPTTIFEEPVLELDEEGTPYWVCPTVRYTIGLYGGKDIDGAVLVNAVTGDSRYYAVKDIPEWVDRVFRADLLIEQFDNYGTLSNGFFNSIFGQRDCRVTTDGYNYMAINDDVYMYSGVTSVTGDESNIGFILCNQRTKQTKYYRISGAEEYSAMSSAEGQVQHLGYRATFPLLLNIGNTPTYFIALKDDAQLVKMYAMVNVAQYQIVASAPDIAECEKQYLELLARNNIGADDLYETVEGRVTRIRSAVIEGNTFYYLSIEGNDRVFRVKAADAPGVILLDQGDTVSIKYRTADAEFTDVSAITVLKN
ncbi:MAG: CvpA family protein [Eubacteriales bacterium]|nr:CvpA family protein [Eubacteriales bacterium]